MAHPLCRLACNLTEGSAIFTARIAFGDEAVANWAMEQDMTLEEMTEMQEKHPRQFESLQKAYFESLSEDEE